MEKLNWSDMLKYGAYALVLAIYGVFAWTGKATVEGYLNVLTAVITAHGATHIARSVREGSGKAKPITGEAIMTPAASNPQAGFASPLLLAVVAALAAMVLMCGCATPVAAPIQLQTPAQVAAQACPQVTAALDALQGLADLPSAAQNDLALAITLTGAVCAIGAIPTQADFTALEKTALPTMVTIIKESSLAVADQNRIALGLDAAQIVLAAANSANLQASQPVKAATP